MKVSTKFIIGVILIVATISIMGLFDFFSSKPNDSGQFVSEHKFKENTNNQLQMTSEELIKINTELASIKIVGERYPTQIQEATGRK